MAMSVADFVDRCFKAAQAGDLHRPLISVQSFIWREALSRQKAVGRVFSSQALDDLCQSIGALPPPPAARPTRSGTVYMVTELQLIGGHTRVLADLVEADLRLFPGRGEPVTILASDVLNQHDLRVAQVFEPLGATIEMAPVGDHGSKLVWLQSRLAHLSPSTTRLLLHPYDSVSIAAAQPQLVGALTFFHNADHNLSLGVKLRHGAHVDFHPKGFYNCREQEGVQGNVVWPLTASDLGPRNPDSFSGGPLRTCTAGGAEKFETKHLREVVDYLWPYDALAPVIPAVTGGDHVHIGPLSEDSLAKIRSGIQALGHDPARFVHVPFAPSLWQALLSLEIDVYVGSFPSGGGRATVEALGAGIPLLIHSNYRSVHLSAENEVYEGAMIWRTPQQLVDHLKNLNPAALAQHSRAARLYYEANHLPEHLDRAITGQTRDWPRPRYAEDRLQVLLDEPALPNGPVSAQLGESAIQLS